MADARTGAAIARALKEDWGFRDVKQFVDKAIAQLEEPAPKKRGRPAEPFKNTERDLVVHKDKLGALTAPQRESLRKALEELLRKLDEKPASSQRPGGATRGNRRGFGAIGE